MKCTIFILTAIIIITAAMSSRASDIDDSIQVVIVISNSWNDLKAKLFLFEKRHEEWIKVKSDFTVVVGGNGMAWGRGLHEKNGEGPIKREGDRRAPAGRFGLIQAMGYAAQSAQDGTSFPYEQIKEGLHCVDDSGSDYYNRIVNESDVQKPAKQLWQSSEIMKRKDKLYKWLLVVDHNVQAPKPGGGSCIFIHVWRDKDRGTAGCTAMEEKDLVTLLSWLNKEKNPVLVQLPAAEYDRYWKEWKLPSPLLLQN